MEPWQHRQPHEKQSLKTHELESIGEYKWEVTGNWVIKHNSWRWAKKGEQSDASVLNAVFSARYT